VRAFVALELQPAAPLAFAALAEELRASPRCPRSRLAWTPEAKMHLTLKFFADLEEGRVPEIAAVLQRLTQARAAPRVRVKELTAFPSPRHASVVVLELEGTALAALAADAEAAFEAIGIPKEQRPFRGHVTLARPRSPVDARDWLAPMTPPVGEWGATELVLFESRLSTGGAVYTARTRSAWA
jgi:RNA 2',3'-cyclic 3'-phosphodiesterase